MLLSRMNSWCPRGATKSPRRNAEPRNSREDARVEEVAQPAELGVSSEDSPASSALPRCRTTRTCLQRRWSVVAGVTALALLGVIWWNRASPWLAGGARRAVGAVVNVAAVTFIA